MKFIGGPADGRDYKLDDEQHYFFMRRPPDFSFEPQEPVLAEDIMYNVHRLAGQHEVFKFACPHYMPVDEALRMLLERYGK